MTTTTARLALVLMLTGCEPGTDATDGFAITSVKAVDNQQLVLEKRLEVELSAAGCVSARCVLDDDEREIHPLASADSAALHELIIRGVCPECRYSCSLEAISDDGESATASLDFEVDPLPFETPQMEIVEMDEDRVWGAYTLATHRRNGKSSQEYKILVMDLEGRVRWYYLVHPLSESTKSFFDASYLDDGRVLFGGGNTMPPTIVNIGAEIEWQGPDPASDGAYDHHVEMLDNGQVLALASVHHRRAGQTWKGFEVLEIDPADNSFVWQFHSQAALDAGFIEQPEEGTSDPWHANAVAWVDDSLGASLWISLRDENALLRVDRDTGEPTMLLGLRQGYNLYDADGQGAISTDWFAGQHAPEFEAPRLLMYDNGYGNGQRSWSRALDLEIDHENKDAWVRWEYLEDDWHERQGGDVDRLPNGNVLITMGNSYGSDTGHTVDDVTSIVEVVPEGTLGGDVVWRLQFTDVADGVYRSQRIDGCDMFANARYCADLTF